MNNTQPDRSALIAELDKTSFAHIDSLIHVFAGGSDQHGAKDPIGGSDLDVCGVFIEPAIRSLGIDREEHFISSTGDQDSRNTTEDKDFALYSLRKWATLAAKGNPTVLSYLFMPATPGDTWDFHIKRMSPIFLATSHHKAFIGYARNQLHRLQGLKGKGRHGQRPEIESAHGYDTKAAMHMIRMMFEIHELLCTGKITFPNPRVSELVDIRLGVFTQFQIERRYNEMEEDIMWLATRNPVGLPKEIDRKIISEQVAKVYLEHYSQSSSIWT